MAALPLSEAIQKYQIPWMMRDWPIDWSTVFDPPGDLTVEIGFGNGGFLVDQARQFPDARFVGIERAWGSISRLFKRLEAASLTNVGALEANAAFALARLFEPQSLARVYINFPDPWHKERHHNRRLIQPPFIRTLAERLKPGGVVTIATDQAEYAAWITEVLQGQSLLISTFDTPYVQSLPDRKPTKYEQKALSESIPIHYFVWRLNNRLNIEKTIEKAESMPNVILEGDCDRNSLLADVEGRVWRDEHRDVPVVIKLMETYSHLSDGHRLVSVMVREGALAQHFGIVVVFRNDNRLLIKLAPIGQPRATWGVKEAVRRVADLIVTTNPDLQIVSSAV